MDRKNRSTENKIGGRIKQTNEQFDGFLDIYIRGTIIGKKSRVGWGDKGWSWFDNEMKAANLNFTREQLKHKWDWMKEQWKLWNSLIGKETEIGWDPTKGTVDASNEWWTTSKLIINIYIYI